MNAKDALLFPVIASCMLFGLYILFKFLGKDYVNYLLSLYFLALGTYAVWGTITPVIAVFVPQSLQKKTIHFKVPYAGMSESFQCRTRCWTHRVIG
jgi:minor histocompatibility antigen H13